MAYITQKELVKRVARRSDGRVTPVAAASAIELALDEIAATLREGNDVQLIGFGTFYVRDRKARVGVNPRDVSQRIEIPARRVPVFRPGATLKRAVGARPPVQPWEHRRQSDQ